MDRHELRERRLRLGLSQPQLATLLTVISMAALGLSGQDLERLSRQGSVSREMRGNRTLFKLRFRRGSQQTVRYIGGAERAAAIRADLQRLQAENCRLRELARLARATRQLAGSRHDRTGSHPSLVEPGGVQHRDRLRPLGPGRHRSRRPARHGTLLR